MSCQAYTTDNRAIAGYTINYITDPNNASGKRITSSPYSGAKYFNLGLDQTAIRAGLTFTSIANNAFENNEHILSVIIPNTITSIGTEVFQGCTFLQTATLSNTMTELPYSTFAGCSSMFKITIPSSITILGGSVFFSCTSLLDVTIDSELTNVEIGAFQNCSSLKSISLPNSITTMGAGVFILCSSLEIVNIPANNTLTTIGAESFAGCTSLITITIPSNITRINQAAFNGCTGLMFVNFLGNAPNPVGANAFNTGLDPPTVGNILTGTTGWTFPPSLWNGITIVTPNVCNGYNKINNAIPGLSIYYDADPDSTNGGKRITSYSYPAEDNFNLDLNNTAISAGITFTAIGGGGYKPFRRCYSMTEVVIPDSVVKIGDGAFVSCYMTSITWPNVSPSLTHIAGSFGGNDITTITLPSTLQVIGDWAFQECVELISLTIPASVTAIGQGSFSQCYSMTEITFSGSAGGLTAVYDEVDMTWNSFPENKPPIIARGTTVNGWITGKQWYGLTIGALGLQAYQNDGTLIDGLTLLYTTDASGKTADITGYNYNNIGILFNIDLSVTASNNQVVIVSIGANAFLNCADIQTIIFAPTLTTIGAGAFKNCTRLTEAGLFIDGSAGITVLSSEVFSGCIMLNMVIIPNTVTDINTSAFQGCTSLTYIIIPDSVTTIGDLVFSGCTALTGITFLGNKPTAAGTTSFPTQNPPTFRTIAYGRDENGWTTGQTYNGLYINQIPECPGKTSSGTTIANLMLLYTRTSTTEAILLGYTYTGTDTFELDIGRSKPNNTTRFTDIGTGAFDSCVKMTSVVIPANTYLGAGCFILCTGLTSVTLPSTLQEIPVKSFSGCSALTTITLPNTLINIGVGAFQENAALSTITFPASLMRIEDSAFAGCTSLVKITIPTNTAIFGDLVFDNTNLGDITFLGEKSSISAYDTTFDQINPPTALGILNYGWVPGDTFYKLVISGNIAPPLCLADGTRVLTPVGYRPVEQLEKFDYVTTADGRNVMIKHVHHSQHYYVGELEAPFYVPAHALAMNVPSHDIKLSPDHLVHVGDDLWLTPRDMAKRSDKVVQYDIGKTIHYYAIMTPNYFQDNLVIEDGVVVEAYGARDLVYDEEKKAYFRKAKDYM